MSIFCCYLVAKSSLTLLQAVNCSPTGSSVHGTSQARILKWVAISFSRESSQTKDGTCISCTGRWILYHWATREALHLLTILSILSWLKLITKKWETFYILWWKYFKKGETEEKRYDSQRFRCPPLQRSFWISMIWNYQDSYKMKHGIILIVVVV